MFLPQYCANGPSGLFLTSLKWSEFCLILYKRSLNEGRSLLRSETTPLFLVFKSYHFYDFSINESHWSWITLIPALHVNVSQSTRSASGFHFLCLSVVLSNIIYMWLWTISDYVSQWCSLILYTCGCGPLVIVFHPYLILILNTCLVLDHVFHQYYGISLDENIRVLTRPDWWRTEWGIRVWLSGNILFELTDDQTIYSCRIKICVSINADKISHMLHEDVAGCGKISENVTQVLVNYRVDNKHGIFSGNAFTYTQT